MIGITKFCSKIMRQNSDFNPQNFTQILLKVRKSQKNVLKFLQKTNKKSPNICLYFFLTTFLRQWQKLGQFFSLVFPDLQFLPYPTKRITFIGRLKYISLIIINFWTKCLNSGHSGYVTCLSRAQNHNAQYVGSPEGSSNS